jgi:hypothetical protein
VNDPAIAGPNSAKRNGTGKSPVLATAGKKELEVVTPEEARRQETLKRQRREEVKRGMSGDFMEGWVSLAKWKSMKTVVPSQK